MLTGYIWKYYLNGVWDNADIGRLVNHITLEIRNRPSRELRYVSPETRRDYRVTRAGKIIIVVEV